MYGLREGWASEQALDIARRTTIARVKKCCQIMGRLENKLTAAQILYPLMQACPPLVPFSCAAMFLSWKRRSVRCWSRGVAVWRGVQEG